MLAGGQADAAEFTGPNQGGPLLSRGWSVIERMGRHPETDEVITAGDNGKRRISLRQGIVGRGQGYAVDLSRQRDPGDRPVVDLDKNPGKISKSVDVETEYAG